LRGRYIYAPYVLVRTFDQWIKRTHITVPSDIRAILEATYSAPANDEPEGWTELRVNLEGRRDNLRNMAVNAALVMRQPALEDDERVQTRIDDVPTVPLVLATAEPVESSSGRIQLPMLDGNEATIHMARFDLTAARIIHRNIVRIPVWDVEAAENAAPQWLSQIVSHNAVLGVVHNGTIYINETDSGLTWNNDEGVAYPPNDL
jgi:CRISPR-associated endonuclease/helicase Cas3